MAVAEVTVRRVDFGWFIRPGSETLDGRARVEPVLGYLIEHPRGRLLVDSGMGSHPEVDEHYRPHRLALPQSLAGAGVEAADIGVVVNCHLHFDHCGNNPALTDRPIFVQSVELAAAHGVDYTLRELVDAPGLRYEELAGEAEIWPGVRIVPTPGHTAGHQSVVVRRGDGSIVVIAGQSHDTATAYAADALALRAAGMAPGQATAAVPPPPEWVATLQAFDPARVYFAHDHSVWTPD